MIYLEAHELKALKVRARAEGVSLAGLMRRLVRDYLTGQRSAASVPEATYAGMVGLGSSGRSDVSERHDSHVADAVKRDHAR